MRKYRFCFLLLAAAVLAEIMGVAASRLMVKPEQALPGATVETIEVTEDQMAANQKPIQTKTGKQYYLVSREGYLFVLDEDQDVCVETHMSLTDFPENEREKLTEGLAFDTMAEIFSYLESYTS